MGRVLWMLAAGSGFFGVALGAFGAHGLKATFEASGEATQRIAWWGTATQYHLVHALAIGFAAVLYAQSGRAALISGGAFAAGIILFSGSLYAMALSGVRALGMVTPLGGLAFLVGWIALAFAGAAR